MFEILDHKVLAKHPYNQKAAKLLGMTATGTEIAILLNQALEDWGDPGQISVLQEPYHQAKDRLMEPDEVAASWAIWVLENRELNEMEDEPIMEASQIPDDLEEAKEELMSMMLDNLMAM